MRNFVDTFQGQIWRNFQISVCTTLHISYLLIFIVSFSMNIFRFSTFVEWFFAFFFETMYQILERADYSSEWWSIKHENLSPACSWPTCIQTKNTQFLSIPFIPKHIPPLSTNSPHAEKSTNLTRNPQKKISHLLQFLNKIPATIKFNIAINISVREKYRKQINTLTSTFRNSAFIYKTNSEQICADNAQKRPGSSAQNWHMHTAELQWWA